MQSAFHPVSARAHAGPCSCSLVPGSVIVSCQVSLHSFTLPCLPTSPPSSSSRRSAQTKICMCDPFLLNCQQLFPIAFRIKPKFLIILYHNRFGLCLFLPPRLSPVFSHPALQIYWPSVFISVTYYDLSYPRAPYPWDPPILTSPSPVSLSPTTSSS